MLYDAEARFFINMDLLLSINDVLLRTPRTLQGLYERKDTFTELRVKKKNSDEESLIRYRILNR